MKWEEEIHVARRTKKRRQVWSSFWQIELFPLPADSISARISNVNSATIFFLLFVCIFSAIAATANIDWGFPIYHHRLSGEKENKVRERERERGSISGGNWLLRNNFSSPWCAHMSIFCMLYVYCMYVKQDILQFFWCEPFWPSITLLQYYTLKMTPGS